MRASAFSIGAFVLHLALGNLCMMPMAMAEEMPDMPGMNHDMGAMASHEKSDDQKQSGMPCDGEHCFTHALPIQTSLGTEGVLVVALPVTPNVIKYSFEHEAPAPLSHAPPGQFIHLETIVLRN